MPTHMMYHEFMSNPTPELLEAFGWWGVDDWETYFTEGECHALAIAIHEATGWDIWAVGTGPDFSVEHWEGHVFIATPDLLALDITGLSTFEDQELLWSNQEHAPFHTSVGVLEAVWDPPDLETARSMVEWTLSNAGLEVPAQAGP